MKSLYSDTDDGQSSPSPNQWVLKPPLGLASYSRRHTRPESYTGAEDEEASEMTTADRSPPQNPKGRSAHRRADLRCDEFWSCTITPKGVDIPVSVTVTD